MIKFSSLLICYLKLNVLSTSPMIKYSSISKIVTLNELHPTFNALLPNISAPFSHAHTIISYLAFTLSNCIQFSSIHSIAFTYDSFLTICSVRSNLSMKPFNFSIIIPLVFQLFCISSLSFCNYFSISFTLYFT